MHIACMVTALICSTVFLTCYLTYHFGLLSAVGEGSVEFTAERLGSTALRCHSDHASDSCIHDPAIGDHDGDPGLASTIRPPPSDGPIYNSDLALRFHDRPSSYILWLYQWFPSSPLG